jgi:integrase
LLFSTLYRFVETAGSRVFDIRFWRMVECELRLAMALAPLLFVSLSAPWFSRVVATDASTEGQGVVASRVDAGVLAAEAAVSGPDPPRFVALDGCDWRTIISSPWRWSEHINVLEARVLLAAVRWVSSFPDSLGSRVLIFSDSAVLVYAARKGRSSAYPLLRVLRGVAAVQLAAGLRLTCGWIPSHANPADEPSRGRQLRDCFRGFRFDPTLGFPGEGPPRCRFLFEQAVKRGTFEKYVSAARRFLFWLAGAGFVPDSIKEMDDVLVEYFHDLYLLRDGRGRADAEATLYAVELFVPRLRRKLSSARLALRGWRRLRPPTSHPPITYAVAVAVACRMASTGYFELGVATLLAFDAYLRVGELVGLRVDDVADVGDHRLGGRHDVMALRLAQTKTGPDQFAEVRDPAVCALVRSVVRLRERDDFLFPFSSSFFRYHFRRACDELCLSRAYVPHSLRHGGATRDFMAGVTLEEVLRRGRWASTKSARHYIQSGRALLLTVEIPADVARVARILAADVFTSMTLAQKH